MTIGDIFNLFEVNKNNLRLETYSLSQTTLEQVFLSFVKKQENQQVVPNISRLANNTQAYNHTNSSIQFN
jgi:hypothetical protein